MNMSLITFQPLGEWPGKPTTDRRRSQFKAGHGATLRLLRHELYHMAAAEIVILLACLPSDIRRDGLPRMGARVTSPGVVLKFTMPCVGPLLYPCDTFDSWEDNLRAIALGLEHLRAVDRYGITKRGEQYRGWAALPPPLVTEAPMTVGHAKDFVRMLARKAPAIPAVWLDWDHVYRYAVKAAHPDVGGSTKDFQRLQEAMYIIKADEAAEGAKP